MDFKPLSGQALKDFLALFQNVDLALRDGDDEVVRGIMAIPEHFTQANIVLGPFSVFKFNAVTFNFTDGKATLNTKDHESNDSGDPNYDNSKTGRQRIDFDVTGYTQSDQVVTPTAAGGGLGSSMAFYPFGVAAGVVYSAATTIITTFEYHAPAASGEPGTLHIAGKSTGTVVHP